VLILRGCGQFPPTIRGHCLRRPGDRDQRAPWCGRLWRPGAAGADGGYGSGL